MKRIEIVVTPTGETTVETKGFQGSSCQVATRFLEKALGKRTSETLTNEFYAETQSENQNQQES